MGFAELLGTGKNESQRESNQRPFAFQVCALELDRLATHWQMMKCVEKSNTIMAYKENQHITLHVTNWVWFVVFMQSSVDVYCNK